VAFAARRVERLEEAVQQAKTDCVAIRCDVRDPQDCDAVVAGAVEAFGGLDAVVYATGIAKPMPLADTDAEQWKLAIETNLIGPSLVTRAAIPHLVQSKGRAVYFSSIAGSEIPPRPYFALYCVTKSALNTLVMSWQQEHHDVGFTSIAIGDTLSEFGTGWSPDDFKYVKIWDEGGYLYGRAMDPESIGVQVASVLASAEIVSQLRIVPRRSETE
jgi:NAD(P)-dependent dehydrogenase (short-subunit alcohol dehydrogenase family)